MPSADLRQILAEWLLEKGKERPEDPPPEDVELKDEEYDGPGEEGDNETDTVPELSIADGLRRDTKLLLHEHVEVCRGVTAC